MWPNHPNSAHFPCAFYVTRPGMMHRQQQQQIAREVFFFFFSKFAHSNKSEYVNASIPVGIFCFHPPSANATHPSSARMLPCTRSRDSHREWVCPPVKWARTQSLRRNRRAHLHTTAAAQTAAHTHSFTEWEKYWLYLFKCRRVCVHIFSRQKVNFRLCVLGTQSNITMAISNKFSIMYVCVRTRCCCIRWAMYILRIVSRQAQTKWQLALLFSARSLYVCIWVYDVILSI